MRGKASLILFEDSGWEIYVTSKIIEEVKKVKELSFIKNIKTYNLIDDSCTDESIVRVLRTNFFQGFVSNDLKLIKEIKSTEYKGELYRLTVKGFFKLYY